MAHFFGTLGDTLGRKPVVILAFTGELLRLLWMLLICESPFDSILLIDMTNPAKAI